MKIRRYLDKDKEKIKKFVASNLMDIFNTDTIAGAEDLEDIKKKFEVLFVIEQKGKIIGTAGVKKIKGDARVSRMYVNKSERGKSIGNKLMKKGIIIPSWLGKKHSLLHRERNSLAKQGENNPMKQKEVRMKVSNTLKQKWKDDKKFAKRMLDSFKHLVKNKFEKEFSKICKEYNLSFSYVGDGSFWIGPCISGKRRNPDFKHLIKKKIILLNGDYWHTKKDINEQIIDYKNKGYNVLSIWQSDWNNSKEIIIEKVKKFSS